jgi:hypothetical protein
VFSAKETLKLNTRSVQLYWIFYGEFNALELMATQQHFVAFEAKTKLIRLKTSRITDNSQTSSLIRPPSSRSFPQRIATQPSSFIFRYPFHWNTCFHYSCLCLLHLLHSFSALVLEMSTQQTSLAYQLSRITDNSQTSSLNRTSSSRSTFTIEQAHEPNVWTSCGSSHTEQHFYRND